MYIATLRLHTASLLQAISTALIVAFRSLLFQSVICSFFFYEINRIDGRTTLKLICRHERCSRKLARYTNHLTFLTRCIKNRVVPKDLRVRPPVPTKGACKVAELASMRFLRERIRLTQKAKGDAKKDTESTAQSITSAPSTNDANRILEQIKTNTNESLTLPKTDISRSLKNLIEKNRRL